MFSGAKDRGYGDGYGGRMSGTGRFLQTAGWNGFGGLREVVSSRLLNTFIRLGYHRNQEVFACE